LFLNLQYLNLFLTSCWQIIHRFILMTPLTFIMHDVFYCVFLLFLSLFFELPGHHSLTNIVVVLTDSFRGMRVRRNSVEVQQLGHAPRSGSELKNGRSSANVSPPYSGGAVWWAEMTRQISWSDHPVALNCLTYLTNSI